MPIYEFYCSACNMLFNFYSKTINTQKQPLCPKCKKTILTRQMSLFAHVGSARDSAQPDDFPMDESKMEKAMNMLAQEAGRINEDDPKQAADLMRKFSNATGMSLGAGMQEALRRMESGEDPDQIEAEMGDLIDDEEPFFMEGGNNRKTKSNALIRDETLYDL